MKKISTFVNKIYFIELTAISCAISIISPLFICFSSNPNLLGVFVLNATTIGLSIFSFLCGFAIFLLGAPIGCSRLIISEKGIELKRLLKKTIYHPWNYYTSCEKAYYLYYGMPSYYIVLSNFKLRTDELSHINGMEMSDRCIRIKYNKKNYDALMQMLPPKLAASLENQFKDIKAPKINLIP